MIKWLWFWKLLKRSFFTLLISCFTLLVNCSVNAVDLHKVWTLTSFNSMEVWVISKGSFLSQRLGSWKPIFAFVSNTNSDSNYQYVYLFWKNWLPYFYNSYTCVWNCSQWNKFSQWFITRYQVCNELVDGDNAVSNCSWAVVGDWTVDALRTFLWTVISSDYYLFDLVNYTYWYWNAKVCISSHQLWQTVCFVDEWISVVNPWNLTWSIGIPAKTDFQNLLSYYYDNSSPAVSGGGGWSIWGWGWTTATFTSGWNITLGCSNWQALSYYRSNWYTKNLCYWGINNSSVLFGEWMIYLYNTPWVWIDLFTVYNNSLSWVENHLQSICRYGEYCTDWGITDFYKYWRIEYDNYSKGYNTWVFNNVPFAIFNLSRFMENYWINFNSSSIIDYCNLELWNLNLIDLYNWVNQDLICSSIKSNVDYTNWSSEVIVWNDLLGVGSGLTTYTNGSVFIDDSINKVKSYWRIPNKSDFWLWYLPQYILSFLCLILVFRFISH